jgi:hypothetical protein
VDELVRLSALAAIQKFPVSYHHLKMLPPEVIMLWHLFLGDYCENIGRFFDNQCHDIFLH